jgi:hypothetical protein
MAITQVIKMALYSSVEAAITQLDSEAPDLDKRLRGLIEQILTSQLPDWRESCLLQRPSLPRYIGVDWRVDVKTASDRMTRMAVPSVLVDLQIQDQPHNSNQVPAARHVEFELSKEALQTVLDGLGRIKDQLGAAAGSR